MRGRRVLGLIAAIGCLLPAYPAILRAQSVGSLSGPSLGYAWSAEKGQLRPIQGILGSVTLGDPVDLGGEVTVMSPLDGRHFLASGTASSLVLVSLDTATPSFSVIDGTTSRPSAMGRSRSGSTIVVYDGTKGVLTVVNGLPSSPKILRTIDVANTVDSVRRLAVSDDGNLVIFSSTRPGSEYVYGWTASAGTRLITIADAVSAIAIADNGDVIIADPAANEVFAVRDPGSSAVRQLLADERNGIADPVGIIVSSGNQIYVANAASGSVLTLDGNGALLRTQACGCSLIGLYPQQDSVYRLTGQSFSTIFLLETGLSGDRIAFVPGLPADE